MRNNKYTALYCRLSKEDEKTYISSSIETQKKYLNSYAIEHHMHNIKYYIDDGYSGTNFDRPAFTELTKDIENQLIDIIITKDLSRLGRNYLTTGYYIEHYFPSNNVRFIAINDQVDTIHQQNDLMPFKNIMNEWYARDISKKIRTAYKTKALNGEFTGAFPPYGYDKDLKNKNKLIINFKQAQIVKEIFNLYIRGYTVYKIGRYLKENKTPTPRADTYTKYHKYYSENLSKYPFSWGSRTILTILSNEEYLGNLVCNKHSTKSYKDKRLKLNPNEEWIITQSTHDSIVSLETFEKVRKIMNSRIKRKVIINNHLFIGKIRCEHCDKTLTYSIDKRRDNRGMYVCSTYRVFGKERCTSHYIRYDIICDYVYNSIKYLINQAKQNDIDLYNRIYQMKNDELQHIKENQTDIVKDNKRLKDIDIIFHKLYEDYALNRLLFDDYFKLIQDFKEEKVEIQKRLTDFENIIEIERKIKKQVQDFIHILKKIEIKTALSKNNVDLLIEKIVVGEKNSKNQERIVQIHYKYIGIM
ncbi:MAG: recombinase family protein [Firmicutes bacterium]|nr:recombinase family protein [Bacillota bacterium]